MSPPNPPWVEFPDIPMGSLGWRMGFGEQYWNKWSQWYLSLPEALRTEFKQQWQEPPEWTGIYSFIERGILPDVFQERQRKLTEPQLPPSADEEEITDYYRIVWLLRHHLKREVYPYGVHGEQRNTKLDEDQVEFHSEPAGTIWRLGFLSKGGLRLSRAQVDA
jgi:hypothetical protein